MSIIIIVAVSAFALWHIIMSLHRYGFMESVQRKAREMPPDDLKHLRDHSRSLAVEANKQRNGSTRSVGPGKAHAN